MKKQFFALLFMALLTQSIKTIAQSLDGVYTLMSLGTNKNLDGNATAVYPHTPNGGNFQKWTIKPAGSVGNRLAYTLTSVGTGKRLDGNPTQLYANAPNGGDFQKWFIETTNTANCFTLTSVATNLRLDGNDTKLYPHAPNGGNFQKWRFTKAVTPEAAFLTVKGRSLIDICGNAVVIKGVNIGANNWGYGPLTTAADLAEIKKTNANAVRIAWYAKPTDAQQIYYTVAHLEAVINLCVQNQLLPIVDMHDLTNQAFSPAFQNTLLNWWTSPDVVNLIKRHEKHLIINIANEYGQCLWAGNTQASKDAFETTYKNAITQLRTAGIRVPLMIDAPDGANSHEVLLLKGQSLLNHDPLHNVLFSVHTYWARFKFTFDDNQNVTGTQPNYLANIQTQMQNIQSSPLCFILGEVANQQDGVSNCQYDLTDVYKVVLTKAQSGSIPYFIWMWYYDVCPNRQMTTNNTASSLSVFGNDVVNNALYGLKTQAKPIKLSCN